MNNNKIISELIKIWPKGIIDIEGDLYAIIEFNPYNPANHNYSTKITGKPLSELIEQSGGSLIDTNKDKIEAILDNMEDVYVEVAYGYKYRYFREG